MKLFNPSDTRVIVLKDGLLTDNQMTSALRMSDTSLVWRAIVQLIEDYRDINTAQASASAGANNPLAMSANCGAHNALTELLADLERRRSSKG